MTYPVDTVLTDILAFTPVYAAVWEELKEEAAFQNYLAAKAEAFGVLASLITPNDHAKHNAFWQQKGPDFVAKRSLTTWKDRQDLCGTLRNGLAHFNYRVVDSSPEDYFKLLGITVPKGLNSTGQADNGRIFVCDKRNKTNLMAPDSNTRIIDVGAAHLRYVLFLFLAHFLGERGEDGWFDDILFPAGRRVGS